MVGEDAGGGEGLEGGERVGDELTATVWYSGGEGSGSGSFSRDEEV